MVLNQVPPPNNPTVGAMIEEITHILGDAYGHQERAIANLTDPAPAAPSGQCSTATILSALSNLRMLAGDIRDRSMKIADLL